MLFCIIGMNLGLFLGFIFVNDYFLLYGFINVRLRLLRFNNICGSSYGNKDYFFRGMMGGLMLYSVYFCCF